jgi:hypothetical protein
LQGNQIGDAGAEKIAECLKINKTLQSIGLESNHSFSNFFLFSQLSLGV